MCLVVNSIWWQITNHFWFSCINTSPRQSKHQDLCVSGRCSCLCMSTQFTSGRHRNMVMQMPWAGCHYLEASPPVAVWGSRVVVPPKTCEAILAELHEGHPGMMRMKALSRMYVWWPGLNKAIELKVSLCDECQMLQSKHPVALLQPWNWPIYLPMGSCAYWFCGTPVWKNVFNGDWCTF